MFDSTKIPPVILDDGRHLPVALVASRRAERIAIRLRSWGTVELVVPRHARTSDALGFLESRMPWLIDRAKALPEAVAFVPGARLPVLGMIHELVAQRPEDRRSFTIGDGQIRVGGEPAHFARRTRDRLRGHARHLLAAKTLAQAQLIGRAVRSVSVGDMRTRWGSCSASGRIRYSWRLVFAPEPVMDYVVSHEVAHLIEMNHARRFWQIVERLCPDYVSPRIWLKQQGPCLLCYG